MFLNHSNTVKLYDILEDDKNLYLLMEYLDQGNLKDQDKEYWIEN